MKKLLKSLAGAGIATLAAVSPVLAGETINIKPTGQFAILQGITVQNTISFAVTFLFIIAGLIFFFMLVWGGIEWITSGGDKQGNENARKRITNALIGLAIVFSAWAILQLINAITGVNLTSPGNIPNLYGG
jgi:hypothetical protein